MLHQVQAFLERRIKCLLTCHVPSEESGAGAEQLCLPYQVRVARLWARAGLYQAGGAIGFRDQLQDMTALMYTHPDEVRRHLLLCASRQYETGDVQHWWHPGGAGVRTRITDDRLFLPFLTAWYVQRTGDKDVLAASVPFLMGADIPRGAITTYTTTAAPTAYAAPLMEHCLRAMPQSVLRSARHPPNGGRRLERRHEPRRRGRVYSWGSSSAACWRTSRRYCEASRGRGRSCWQVRASRCWRRLEAPRLGRRMVCTGVVSENGQVLGSRESPACRIDLLSQCWAVLGGASPGAWRRKPCKVRSGTQLHRPVAGPHRAAHAALLRRSVDAGLHQRLPAEGRARERRAVHPCAAVAHLGASGAWSDRS